ncbi:AAA family ATPase [Rothia terrae]|uniref:AAA family ATPase n=1 Tax=Rothia terrae TaxID=396015 RepID=UPI0014450CE0|nr:AAA family ATPase [Rothia terrae]NKZ33607.1 AAA family ATPase [Rothia terrae]
MVTQITAKNQIIDTCSSIDLLLDLGLSRGNLSQLISSFLRNLSEGILVAADLGINEPMNWENIQSSSNTGKNNKEIKYLKKVHEDLQISFSHYTRDEQNSERLLLKYIEFLSWSKDYLLNKLHIDTLQNLNKFPLNSDPGLQPYYKKISDKLAELRLSAAPSIRYGYRYYIHSCTAVFYDNKIIYEVTYYDATDFSSPQDRKVCYFDKQVPANTSIQFNFYTEEIEIEGNRIPIQFIDYFTISIRPSELRNIAQLVNLKYSGGSNNLQYKALSEYLTLHNTDLYHVINSEDDKFDELMEELSNLRVRNKQISEILTKSKEILSNSMPGHRTLSYLLLKPRNKIIKTQIAYEKKLQAKYVHNFSSRCYPFEKDPLTSSLIAHNPKLSDVLEFENIDSNQEKYLYRLIESNIINTGSIYLSRKDILTDHLDDSQLNILIEKFNSSLDKYTENKKIIKYGKNVTIKKYEDDIAEIINIIQQNNPISGYRRWATDWISTQNSEFLSNFNEEKIEILPKLFDKNSIAFVYGPAGTGKSTMINFLSNLFSGKKKIFLAQTHTAVNNLIDRVDKENSNTFSTVQKFLSNRKINSEKYELVIIDESSTIDNNHILKILKKIDYKYLLFVGDNYQIESIDFGNWFDICRSNKLPTNRFELTEIHRTSSDELKLFWGSVRDKDTNIIDRLSSLGISQPLNQDILSNYSQNSSSAILCLTYGGLFGINNMNVLYQKLNPQPEFIYQYKTYKVNDPIIFIDHADFKNVFYNNQKGIIRDIKKSAEGITFTVELLNSSFEFSEFPEIISQVQTPV